MMDADLHRRLHRLIAVRAVVSASLLGSTALVRIAEPRSLAADPLFGLASVACGLSIGAALTFRYVERRRWLADLQLVGDALIVSTLVHLTGGITSDFTSLLVLPILAASTVRFRRGGLLIATVSAALYAGLVSAQYLTASGIVSVSAIARESAVLPPRSVAQYSVALNVLGFFAVALLSGSLANSLRSAGARLEQVSTEIADLQALNQHVIDSLPSGLVTTDPSQGIVSFNRAAEAITGVPARSACGRPVGEVLQLPAEYLGTLERRIEFRYRPGDGRGEIDIGLTATHLETPRGRAGYLFTFQDVTKIKKLQREAAIQQRLAAIGEMAAAVAHEIRNPLASMSGSIQILRQELTLRRDQERLMDIVLRESERLNATIRSFLDYARPQRFAIAPVDLRRALTDTAVLLRNSADVHEGHTIEVDVPPDELWYEADEGQIRQIVWNLATNGLRAMPRGGRLELVAAPDPGAHGVVLTVRDEGSGIPAGELDDLFQPFHGRFTKGTGLGLAIVHRIVADYNGEIRFSSEPGRGTTVSVRLPAPAMAVP